jgi:lysophospholipase L1-like esterase
MRRTARTGALTLAFALALAGCGSGTPAAKPRHHTSPTARPADASSSPSQGGTQSSQTAQSLQTSCSSVVHIGDSTSDGLVLPAYQPDPKLRIAAQYRRVGVRRFINEVSGARSIYETWHGFPNGYTVAQRLVGRGYQGCWVVALGTNDAADIAVGSAMNQAARIHEMMTLFNGQPVLWINVVSLLHSGPYAESNMQKWNQALLRACAQYPNMRVYDWAAVVKPWWFIPDGIHYTPQGYAKRSRDIADALALAFPAGQPVPPPMPLPALAGWQAQTSQNCLVRYPVAG